MNVAVCLRCGGRKGGPLTRCASCGHLPDGLEEEAKHLLVSSHCRTLLELEDAAARIRRGEKLAFDAKNVRDQMAVVERMHAVRATRRRRKIVLWSAVLLALFAAALISLDWLIGYPTRARPPSTVTGNH